MFDKPWIEELRVSYDQSTCGFHYSILVYAIRCKHFLNDLPHKSNKITMKKPTSKEDSSKEHEQIEDMEETKLQSKESKVPQDEHKVASFMMPPMFLPQPIEHPQDEVFNLEFEFLLQQVHGQTSSNPGSMMPEHMQLGGRNWKTIDSPPSLRLVV